MLNNLAVGGSETKVVRLANSLTSARGIHVGVAYLNEPRHCCKTFKPMCRPGTCRGRADFR